MGVAIVVWVVMVVLTGVVAVGVGTVVSVVIVGVGMVVSVVAPVVTIVVGGVVGFNGFPRWMITFPLFTCAVIVFPVTG